MPLQGLKQGLLVYIACTSLLGSSYCSILSYQGGGGKRGLFSHLPISLPFPPSVSSLLEILYRCIIKRAISLMSYVFLPFPFPILSLVPIISPSLSLLPLSLSSPLLSHVFPKDLYTLILWIIALCFIQSLTNVRKDQSGIEYVKLT